MDFLWAFMSTFGGRLRGAMMAAGVTTTEVLARRLKVSPQVVRKWLRDTKPRLSAENIVSLSEHLNVRVMWLTRGSGPIHAFSAAEYTETELLKAFVVLDLKDRRLVRDFVGMLMRHAVNHAE